MGKLLVCSTAMHYHVASTFAWLRQILLLIANRLQLDMKTA